MGFHTVIFEGRLGRDVEMRYTPEGKSVASFSVAVDDGFGDKKGTIWIKTSCWDKLAENANQYLHKGDRVLVEGHLVYDKATGSPRMFQKQDGTNGVSFEVTAVRVDFLTQKPVEEQTPF
jgi:single-strand DNA-binding protein